MTTLPDRPNSALLIIDVQNGVVAGAPRRDEVVANINTLAERGVGQLVVTGAQTDACVRSTLHGAFVRGYDVMLVGDAHTTEDLTEYGAPPPEQVIAHTNLYWDDQRAPGRRGATIDTADVSFG